MKALKTMKAITLWNPWAMFIPWGEKNNETRSWETSYRGPLAIHAAKNTPAWAKKLCNEEPFKSTLQKHGAYNLKTLPSGCVVALCNLVDCLKIEEDGLYQVMKANPNADILLFQAPLPTGNELAFGDYRPGRFAWILKDVQPLPEPVPAKGAQLLWNWEVPLAERPRPVVPKRNIRRFREGDK